MIDDRASRRSRRTAWLPTIAGLFALSAANAAADVQPPADFAAGIERILKTSTDPLLRDPNFARDREAVERVYAQHGYAPLWFENGMLTLAGNRLLQTLQAADEYGLRPEDYDGAQLAERAVDNSVSDDAPNLARVDLAVTVDATRFLRHLHFGRVDPATAGFNWHAQRAPFDLAGIVQRLATTNDPESIVAEAEPHFLHYHLLKRALQTYRRLALEPELTELPPFAGRSIKPGETYIGASALRRLLTALGDLPGIAATDETTLDQALVAGIMNFQRRHGLAVDGAIGRKTFAALTTPLSARVEQLSLTLERWRWLPEFSTPPIVVNIPEFRLFAFRSTQDRAADILQMDVIVGKTFPSTQTPIFMADMTYVVFRPYWDVPDSILRKEMLPEIRTKPDYLAKNDLEIVTNDTTAALVAPSPEAIAELAAGKLRLRQRPGPNNSLGLVKLMLPNPYNVYLHSTPAQRLFQEPRRAFSHGCIRVSDPVALAEHVLFNNVAGGDPDPWTRTRIEAAMHDESPAGQNRHVFLKRPIPVLVVYGTAMALENGEVLFFDDIYGHDAKLKKLLRNPAAHR